MIGDLARSLAEAIGKTRTEPNIQAIRQSIMAKWRAMEAGEELPSPVWESTDWAMRYGLDPDAIRESLRRKLIPEDYTDEEDHTDEAEMQVDAAGAS